LPALFRLTFFVLCSLKKSWNSLSSFRVVIAALDRLHVSVLVLWSIRFCPFVPISQRMAHLETGPFGIDHRRPFSASKFWKRLTSPLILFSFEPSTVPYPNLFSNASSYLHLSLAVCPALCPCRNLQTQRQLSVTLRAFHWGCAGLKSWKAEPEGIPGGRAARRHPRASARTRDVVSRSGGILQRRRIKIAITRVARVSIRSPEGESEFMARRVRRREIHEMRERTYTHRDTQPRA